MGNLTTQEMFQVIRACYDLCTSPASAVHPYDLDHAGNRCRCVHLGKDRRRRLAQSLGEALADLVEVVAGKTVQPHDGLGILSFHGARDERRVMFRTDLGLDAAQSLLQRGRLPFAFLEGGIACGYG